MNTLLFHTFSYWSNKRGAPLHCLKNYNATLQLFTSTHSVLSLLPSHNECRLHISFPLLCNEEKSPALLAAV